MRKLLRVLALAFALTIFAAAPAEASYGYPIDSYSYDYAAACRFAVNNYTAWDPWGYGYHWAEAGLWLEGCWGAGYPRDAQWLTIWVVDSNGTFTGIGWRLNYGPGTQYVVSGPAQAYENWACVQWKDFNGNVSNAACVQ